MKLPILLGALLLSASPAVAENGDPFRYINFLPSDCGDVREMQNMRTEKMEYLYVNTCNRAGFSRFSKLNGVRKVKETVIYIPKQALGGHITNFGGYYCSMLPNWKLGKAWTCTANGWALYK